MFRFIKNLHPRLKTAIKFGIITAYFYKKHQYDKQLFDRMNVVMEEVNQGKRKLSGVYVQNRQPLGFLWMIQWWLPYHQSLKFEFIDGTERKVGLGSPSGSSMFDMTSELILQMGGKYDELAKYEFSVPIECCIEFERRFGHYVVINDVDALVKLTLTREETDDFLTVTYGKPFVENGKVNIVTCRSVVLDLLKKAEDQEKMVE